MRDDLHRTAKCHRVWQDVFGLGLNAADRAVPDRLRDGVTKAILRELRDELSDALKAHLRALSAQPSLVDPIAGYSPRTALEIAVCAELRGSEGAPDVLAALASALAVHAQAYLREFDARMIDGKVFERREVDSAIRDALRSDVIRDACQAFLRGQTPPDRTPSFSIDEDIPVVRP